MKVALVYDRVNKIGGAERVLTALHELWPDAPLFTSVFDPKKAPWAKSFTIKTAFLQHIPFAKNYHEFFPWLTPFAFGSLSFDEYDVVISVTSAEAKGIITKPNTMHICYCLTPTRYLWSGVPIYKKNTGFGIFHAFVKFMYSLWLPTLRYWDFVVSQRPDYYVAISQRVKGRIENYYKRTVDKVVYPPVDTDFFQPSGNKKESGDYYLLVSRLVPYKRADIVVEACTRLKKPLVVVGEGIERRRLQRRAGPTVRFIHRDLTDNELLRYYRYCRAFLYAGDEDFGIVAAEAQSCGKPVIAYAQSGMSEIIQEGKTGLTFTSQSIKGLEEAITQFEKMRFLASQCRRNALRFQKNTFKKEIKEFIDQKFKNYLTSL